MLNTWILIASSWTEGSWLILEWAFTLLDANANFEHFLFSFSSTQKKPDWSKAKDTKVKEEHQEVEAEA